jgi:hypothetical protein
MTNEMQEMDDGRQESSLPAHFDPELLKLQFAYGCYTAVPAGILLDIMTAGQHGESAAVALLLGGAAGYWAPQLHKVIGPGTHAAGQLWAYLNRNNSGKVRHHLLDKNWWLYGEVSTPYAEPDEAQIDANQADELKEGQEEDDLAVTEKDALFTLEMADDTNGVARLTIEQIVRNCEPNSYKIFIGRSLTKPGNKAVLINFYKQHFRFMGASQRGKSSMVAAFLDIITQTHDPKHVRLALLDKEDQTGNLFAHLPHVARIKQNGQMIKLHARTNAQVLEHLIHCVEIMEFRYTLSKQQVLTLPILLVYIEEFLDLKNYFKRRIDQAKGEQAKEQAKSDYATFVYCIEVLSQRGLKARVQLLLCAQVEYANDDFREAMANIGCGFSFCVRPTAAQAAGFKNNALLKRNAEDNKVGQAVVETPDCNDLILAPEYDLEKRLIAFENEHPDIHPIHHSPDEGVSEHENEENGAENVNTVNMVNEPVKLVNASVNGSEYSPRSENIHPAFTPAEETQVLLAYAEMLRSGTKITRTGIRDYLGWDNKEYQRIVKPVCDKHNIG